MTCMRVHLSTYGKIVKGKGHGDKFQIKCSTDHWHDSASVASFGSHREKRGSQYLSATNSPELIPKTWKRKAH
jgi:hypothetical protein